MDAIQSLGIQEALERLETVSRNLGGTDSSLDRSMQLVEYGVALAEHCNRLLETRSVEPMVMVLDDVGKPVDRKPLPDM